MMRAMYLATDCKYNCKFAVHPFIHCYYSPPQAFPSFNLTWTWAGIVPLPFQSVYPHSREDRWDYLVDLGTLGT